MRRKKFVSGLLQNEMPTSILSLNQLISIFLACYAFFLYGAASNPMNHYLAWPRLLALLMLVMIFYQIVIDRKDSLSKLVFYSSIGAILAAFLAVFLGEDYSLYSKYFAQGLVVLATIVLAQGYIHQIILIRKSGRTGAVSISFHQCVLLTAISTVIFGVVLGLEEGWPLILLASTSMTLKIITLWHFRWVRISEKAAKMRAAAGV